MLKTVITLVVYKTES